MDFAKEGVTLDQIDEVVHNFIVENGGYPSAIDFMHFPKSVCTSINDVVSHGVPCDYKLENGDDSERRLFKLIDQAITNIEENAFCGIQIS